ncbi:MAG: hypothetical protein ACT4QG_10835 [Sporichthyaceae bacterium]
MEPVSVDYAQLRRFAARLAEQAQSCRTAPEPPQRVDLGRSSGEAEVAFARIEDAMGRLASGLDGLARGLLDCVDAYQAEDAASEERLRRAAFGGGS